MYSRKLETRTKECNRADRNGRVQIVKNIPRASESTPVRQELNRIKLSALTLTETLQSPHSEIPAHAHDKASLCLTLSGQALEIIERARVITQPGGGSYGPPK
jgi:hypothetical protein